MTVCSVLHLMRVTIEAKTPLSIGTGGVVDSIATSAGIRRTVQEYESAEIVRDANGLPTIPGAALQGVLRGLYKLAYGETRTETLFGYMKDDKGRAGRLIVGWGAVHDVSDTAVVGLRNLSATNDTILKGLLEEAPIERDHVALNGRHVADGRKKFSRAAVPRGARFSVEFAQWGLAGDEANDRASLIDIAGLFYHPAFRLGGSSRRGYGRIDLVSATYAKPDLQNSETLRILRRQPPSQRFAGKSADIAGTPGFRKKHENASTRVRVTLTPINPWRVGSGRTESMTEGTFGVRQADGVPNNNHLQNMEPRSESKTQNINREPWIKLRGQILEWRQTGTDRAWEFRVPGSALKGPLAHRAVYHFNRMHADRVINVETWLANSQADRREALDIAALRPAALEALFGAAKANGEASEGRAGRLSIGDGTVLGSPVVQAIDHNSIDRFTGGVRNGQLYTEEVLVGGVTIVFDIELSPPFRADCKNGERGPPARTEAAFDPFLDALADLCQGRLAIGAKSLGFCEGTVKWSGKDSDLWAARCRTRGLK